MNEVQANGAAALLAWGVDLGHEKGDVAQLFEGTYIAGDNESEDWRVVAYGSDSQYRAIVLARSAEYVQDNTGDKDVSHWLSGAMTSTGPRLDSAPTSDERDELKALLMQYATTEQQKHYELTVGALLLPSVYEQVSP